MNELPLSQKVLKQSKIKWVISDLQYRKGVLCVLFTVAQGKTELLANISHPPAIVMR